MSTILNRFLVSSVIRGSELSQSHGGLYLVDFSDASVRLCLDWANTEIDVDGRGGDRGLRGIAIAADGIWVASSCALLHFDRRFNLRDSFANPYLKHCHEIALAGDHIHVVSTGFDALLRFSRTVGRFDMGYHLHRRDGGIAIARFDPGGPHGPAAMNAFHLNSVTGSCEDLHFSGLRAQALFRINGPKVSIAAKLPLGTHNAQPFGDGVIFNDTASDRLCVQGPGVDVEIDARFELRAQTMKQKIDPRMARAHFARGLLPINNRVAVGGVSPSALCLYDLRNGKVLERIRISDDIRNAVHGIAAWPQSLGNRQKPSRELR